MKSKDLSASVIIPTYGRPVRLLRLLERLLVQETSNYTYEVIIVDDGSPEPVESALKHFGRNPAIPLRLIRKANEGPAVARNYGAQGARGEYLIFVDDDMLVGSDFVKGHLAIQFEFGPALVNCRFDWQVDAWPEPFQRWYRKRTAEWTKRRCSDSGKVAEGVYEIPPALATTANLSVRRADFERAGGFDAGYPFGCEDQDFGLRMERVGLRALATNKTFATHVESHNTLKLLCQRQRKGAIDTVRFVRRFAVEQNFGEPNISKVFSRIRWSKDAPSLVIKKTVRRLVGSDLFSPMIFGGVTVIEKIMPNVRLLPAVYDLVVSAWAQKGWREGIKLYRSVQPLSGWMPARVK